MLTVKLELVAELMELGGESYSLSIEVSSESNPLPIKKLELDRAVTKALHLLPDKDPAEGHGSEGFDFELWFDGKKLRTPSDESQPNNVYEFSKTDVLDMVYETVQDDNWHQHIKSGRCCATMEFEIGSNTL